MAKFGDFVDKYAPLTLKRMTLSFFTDWWNELTIAKQLFYGIGIIAGLVSIILMVLAMFGMEDVDGADIADVDVDHGGGGILSLKPLTGFFLGFGWVGGMCLDKGLSIPLATGAGLLAGGVMLGIIVAMFRAILSLRSDGTMQINKTVGCVGTAYLTIPPSRASGGQVIVNFQGRQETFAALNKSEVSVPSGDKVKVLEVLDPRTLLIEPLQ